MKKCIIPLLLIFTFISCQKELSVENGAGVNPPQPPIGNNCKVNQIISADSLTGQGLFSVYTRFNASGVAEKVEVYDSLSGSMQAEASLQYKGDTIRVSPSDYFLVDANKRVRAFQTIDLSGGSSDTLKYVYNYDGNGYLSNKEIFVSRFPFPVIRFNYVWSAQNLVSIDGSVVVPGITQKVLTATLEYESSLTAKNFIHVLPDGFETAFFIMGLDLGKKSRNLVKKTVVSVYDDTGALDEVYTTSFSKYVFSSDGYLLEWYASGLDSGGTLLPSGRTLFKYFCN
jgi:hypothetical protein